MPSEKRINYKHSVYQLVRRIPAGKVTTYGAISRQIGISPKMVGWALHQNRSADVPCHRVVDRNGRLAPNFAFDGPDGQRKRLVAEGVKFSDKMYVDFAKSLWK